MKIPLQEKRKFQKTVWDYYKTHGRKLPWRRTKNPYHILVSEVMLQQTQVSRVAQKYPLFIKKFPSVRALARAPLRDMLAAWSGLGYNRRAKFLHELSKLLQATTKDTFLGILVHWYDCPVLGMPPPLLFWRLHIISRLFLLRQISGRCFCCTSFFVAKIQPHDILTFLRM